MSYYLHWYLPSPDHRPFLPEPASGTSFHACLLQSVPHREARVSLEIKNQHQTASFFRSSNPLQASLHPRMPSEFVTHHCAGTKTSGFILGPPSHVPQESGLVGSVWDTAPEYSQGLLPLFLLLKKVRYSDGPFQTYESRRATPSPSLPFFIFLLAHPHLTVDFSAYCLCHFPGFRQNESSHCLITCHIP